MEERNKLTTNQVRQMTGYSAVHIWRMEQADRFPKRTKTGPKMCDRVYWNAEDVAQWIKSRKQTAK